jgi:hypothetical protein
MLGVTLRDPYEVRKDGEHFVPPITAPRSFHLTGNKASRPKPKLDLELRYDVHGQRQGFIVLRGPKARSRVGRKTWT